MEQNSLEVWEAKMRDVTDKRLKKWKSYKGPKKVKENSKIEPKNLSKINLPKLSAIKLRINSSKPENSTVNKKPLVKITARSEFGKVRNITGNITKPDQIIKRNRDTKKIKLGKNEGVKKVVAKNAADSIIITIESSKNTKFFTKEFTALKNALIALPNNATLFAPIFIISPKIFRSQISTKLAQKNRKRPSIRANLRKTVIRES